MANARCLNSTVCKALLSLLRVYHILEQAKATELCTKDTKPKAEGISQQLKPMKDRSVCTTGNTV